MLPAKNKIKRSRFGCHRCKKLKVKCSEDKPACASCIKVGEKCDYTLKLTWGGRPYKNAQKRQVQMPVDVPPAQMPRTPEVLSFVPSDFNKDVSNVSPRDRPSMKVESHPLPLSHSPVSHSSMAAQVYLHNNQVSPVKQEDEPERRLSDPLRIFTANSPLSYFIANHLSEAAETDLSGSAIEHIGTDATHFAHHVPSPSLSINPLPRYDNYSSDLEKIERTFPLDPRLPYFRDFLGHSPVKIEPEDVDEVESLDAATALDASPRFDPSSSIPTPLVPLPEILLKVPYYRQLLHFWVNVAADNLVPAPSLYKDNPFKVILPQMAMHYSGVLTTLLAVAARARANLEGATAAHQRIIDQLLGRSCNELLRLLQDKKEATSDGTLATSLLLSVYEISTSYDVKKHRTHAIGASQIMTARVKKGISNMRGFSLSEMEDSVSISSDSSTSSRTESDMAFFLLRWFTYVDVLGGLSSARERDNYLRAYRKGGGYEPVEAVAEFDVGGLTDPTRDIDFLLGFDVRLLPHFINISLLVDEVEKYMSKPESDHECVPLYIIAYALELADKFKKAYEEAEAKRQQAVDEMIEDKQRGGTALGKWPNISVLMDKDNTLRSTNRLYFDAGLLNLYRRVLLLPRTSLLVRLLVAEMTQVFEQCIEPGSPAEICTIFCLFCAGCDTLELEKQEFFVLRFTNLAQRGHRNAPLSLVIMNRCWETGEDWITAANMLDIDLVLM